MKRSTCGSLVCIALTCFLALTPSTRAGEPSEPPRYRIVQGQGYTACEAFVKNLNAFPIDDSMACDLKIHRTHPEFSRPQWEELDVQTHLDLVYEAENLLMSAGSKPPPFVQWQSRYQERVASDQRKPPRLRKATLDLNGSGPETLIWYEVPGAESCPIDEGRQQYVDAMNSFGGHVFVQRRATGELERIYGFITTNGRTDVLLHAGRPYFANAYLGPIWAGGESKRVLRIGIHPIARRLTDDGKYGVPARCYCQVDR